MGETKATGPRLKRLKKAPFDIEVKRFYVPAVIFDTCPNCGHHVKMDMTRDPDYLSYPTAGVPFDVTMYCHASPKGEYCGHEWKVKVQLDISLKLVKEKT